MVISEYFNKARYHHKVKRYYTPEQQADLDKRTAVNKIGEVINLSQELNSMLWDRMYNGETYNDVKILGTLRKYISDRKNVFGSDLEKDDKFSKSQLLYSNLVSDSTAILKRKLFWYHFPTVDYKWICYSKIDGGWCEYEYVKKQRAERKKQKQNKK